MNENEQMQFLYEVFDAALPASLTGHRLPHLLIGRSEKGFGL